MLFGDDGLCSLILCDLVWPSLYGDDNLAEVSAGYYLPWQIQQNMYMHLYALVLYDYSSNYSLQLLSARHLVIQSVDKDMLVIKMIINTMETWTFMECFSLFGNSHLSLLLPALLYNKHSSMQREVVSKIWISHSGQFPTFKTPSLCQDIDPHVHLVC